jgi:hypothetical protein
MALLLPACSFDPAGVPHDGSAPVLDANGPDAPGGDAPIGDGAPADAAPVDAAPTCPDGYQAAAGLGHYRFVDANATWAVALADCADDLPGLTHLAVIGDDAENDHADDVSGTRDVWIGATDAADEGVWLDVLGAAQVYDNWALFEPNNGGVSGPDEHCAELYDGGAWNDLRCEMPLRYLCECDVVP